MTSCLLQRMFKFSFASEGDESAAGNNAASSDDLHWIPAQCVPVKNAHLTYASSVTKDSLQTFHCRDMCIYHISISVALRRLENTSDENNVVGLAEQLHSDLVPAKYEGGLKVWECTVDLLDWLLVAADGIDLKGKRVLDLGCGAGLLGIAALKHGAFVDFQDYNKEVLETTTIPNVLLNLSDEDRLKVATNEKEAAPCHFYAGDWSSFSSIKNSVTEEFLYDYILTSETIYNPSNNEKLYKTFRDCLKKSGAVFLAAKTYYFGVGGGLRQFESVVQKDGKMKTEVCWKCPDGVQREILKITFDREESVHEKSMA